MKKEDRINGTKVIWIKEKEKQNLLLETPETIQNPLKQNK